MGVEDVSGGTEGIGQASPLERFILKTQEIPEKLDEPRSVADYCTAYTHFGKETLTEMLMGRPENWQEAPNQWIALATVLKPKLDEKKKFETPPEA